MDMIVGIIIGFIACLILIMGWVTKQIDMARNAYDRSIALNEKTRDMLSKVKGAREVGK